MTCARRQNREASIPDNVELCEEHAPLGRKRVVSGAVIVLAVLER